MEGAQYRTQFVRGRVETFFVRVAVGGEIAVLSLVVAVLMVPYRLP